MDLWQFDMPLKIGSYFPFLEGFFGEKKRLLLLYFRCFAKLPFSCPEYQRFLKFSKVSSRF